MTPTPPPETKGYTFTLGQLIGFIYGPGAVTLGVVIKLVIMVVTMQLTIAEQERKLAEQTVILGKIQDIVLDVRLVLAPLVAKPKPQAPTE